MNFSNIMSALQKEAVGKIFCVALDFEFFSHEAADGVRGAGK
jgi:hypothetical protein